MTDDLISRQAAIEAVHKVIFEFFDPCGDDKETPFTEKDKLLLKVNKAISNSVKSLPTAEPDMARAISTILENEQDMRVIKRNAEPRWIPVTERLPEDLEEVNVTWVNHEPEPYYDFVKDKHCSGSAVYYKGSWYWYSSTCVDVLAEYGRNVMDKIDVGVEVLAWMPLPNPWKGESDG